VEASCEFVPCPSSAWLCVCVCVSVRKVCVRERVCVCVCVQNDASGSFVCARACVRACVRTRERVHARNNPGRHLYMLYVRVCVCVCCRCARALTLLSMRNVFSIACVVSCVSM
jgi:hypothetical protein